MEKTLSIGGKEVRLTNNIGWTLAYRDQFGQDIIATLTPVLAAAVDLISGFLQEAGDGKTDLEITDVLRALDGDVLINAVAHLSGLEFVDLVNITWAMAKAADDNIPEPRMWVREFEEFPVDEIIPEVVKLAVKGLISRKNLTRLKNLTKSVKGIRPLTSTQSSLPDSKED